MIKTKFFFNDFNRSVNSWLLQNQNIEILSTNLCGDQNGWAYVILYKEINS
jgi:hypothetical protein